MMNKKNHHGQAATSATDGVSPSRRGLLRAAPAGLVAGALTLGMGASDASARGRGAAAPVDSGKRGRRILIKGGAVLSMDPKVGDFPCGDVLIEGNKILAVGPSLSAAGATVVDADGMIVMPGFIDTHHHEFETAMRGVLGEALLLDDGSGKPNYFDDMLGRLSPVYRPEDVYIAALVGALSQIDAGVTSVVDTSQISNSPAHSDALVAGLLRSQRRALVAYSSGLGGQAQYPNDVHRLRERYFSSQDQLLTLGLGAEVFDPHAADLWRLARSMELPIISHVVGSLGGDRQLAALGAQGLMGPDCVYIHCTNISPAVWKLIKDTGGHVSIASPIEMTMRHGMPAIQTALDLGIQPSLSVDVECTMTADFFTQMRSVFTLQRGLVNERAIGGEKDLPALLTCRDVLRFATVEGARGAQLAHKVGSLTPGKEADLIMLRADAINVMPLNNVPSAVVTLMERSNVAHVFVAGKILKWNGQLQDVDLRQLKTTIKASAAHLLKASGVRHSRF